MTPRAIVTDIEGTTSSIAFVHDVLFPYARARLPAFVRANPQLVGGEVEAGIARLLAWMDADAKETLLKDIQGRIWAQGYAAGELRGHIYPDAAAALRRWHDEGIALYVYSSGSVAAQRLIFGHSEAGDLTPLFAGYFDTTTGPKRAAASYAAIAGAIGEAPGDILFLSDVAAELDAARAAGLAVVLVAREGAGEAGYPAVASFDELQFESVGA